MFDDVTLFKHVTTEEEMHLSCLIPFLQYGKIALTSDRIVILVINNAMAKMAIQIKSSPPGAGLYLLFIS